MIYPILTVLVGSIVVITSGISLYRCVRDGGIFINQLRILASGVLLTAHFPLTHFLDGLILPGLEKIGAIDGNVSGSYWIYVALIVTGPADHPPTGRELYATYMADRLTPRAGD